MATVAPEIPVLATDEAFEKLYRQYVKDVYHYALALLRNPVDAEDVTQTTFMNAYRAYRRGDEILKPHNWLIKIAHNVARTRYSRMSRRVKEVPLDDHMEQLALPEDERPDVEGVLRALGRLPFNQRAALVMRELEGRTYAEIADTLDVSVAAVETLIFRARRSLRVRAAALKSIAAVPLPSSLTQLLGGGGAVAGGIGSGVVVKAAVALVAGVFATGLGGDRSNRADAAAAARPAAAATAGVASPSPSSSRSTGQRLGAKAAAARVRTKARGSRPGRLHVVAVTRSAPPAPAPARVPPSQPQASSAQPLPTPPAVLTDTVAAAVGTVEKTVATATEALPVKVPELPVQAPPLPKLP